MPVTANTHAREARAASLSLRLLSGFELRRDGDQVELPLSVQRVIAFLALADRPLQRVYVSGSLWANSSETRANGNLRTVLWRLRQPGVIGIVNATNSHLCLGTDVQVDVRETTTLARRVLDGSTDRVHLRVLADGGELLPDWYEDWVLTARERVRQLRLHALEALCAALAHAGQLADAVEAGLAAVADEPLRESAHRAVIRTHIADGNTSEAIHQYKLYRSLLREQLGLEPSPQLRELVAQLPVGDDYFPRNNS